MPKSVVKSFKATLERDNTALGWVIAHVPFDVRKTWGAGGRPRVKGEINGFGFRTSLFPTRTGSHFLLVNKRMQTGGKAAPGSVAQFRLEPDTEDRTVAIPAELKSVLAEDRSLGRWFAQLSFSMRNWISRWIVSVRNTEVRMRRAERAAEWMLAAMEGERELPPIMQVEFSRYPHAREGWARLTPTQRRHHLMGIFYVQSPQARTKRVGRAIQDAIKAAERPPKKRAARDR